MTEKVVQSVQECAGSGNTITDPAIKKKQPNPSKKWCFTLNNYTDYDFNEIHRICCVNSAKFIIGKEVGESGTPHLQGYIEFTRRVRPKGIFPIDRIHWESARGTRADNTSYCSKDGNYISNMHIDKPLILLDETKFYPWQAWLYNMLALEPDSRTVIWIWESIGNIGKSAFGKLMCAKYNAISVDGKANDIFNGISNYKDNEGCFPRTIIIDCPRHNIDYMNYGAIEKVKNGHIFNGKYESKQLLFNPPHVVVFANSPPDFTKFSKDRWVVKEIRNKMAFI